MATEPVSTTLLPPPRTSGNIQGDIPVLVDWLWQAYNVISASVAFINSQITENPDIDLNDLPDPATATIASAQQTANQAYVLAQQAKTAADNAADDLAEYKAAQISGTFTITDAATSATTAFPTAQADTNFRVFVQAMSITGTPVANAYTIQSKTYTTSDFSVNLVAAPGVGSSVTFEWQLIRNT